MAIFYSTDILDTIQKIRQKWQNEPTIWDSGLLGDPVTDPKMPSDAGDDLDLPPVLPRFVTDTTSFVFQATHANIDIKSITPLSVEAANTDPTGETDRNMSEHGNWYYYVFDWRNYQNIMGEEAEAYDFNAPGGFALYFEKLAKASLPYFARLHGKKMTKNGVAVNPNQWFYDKKVQFGGYTVEAREAPAQAYGIKQNAPDTDKQILEDAEKWDQHTRNVNPGLTFLIGIPRHNIISLDSDDTVEISMQDLRPERAIIMRHGSMDKVFENIKSTLNTYHGIREEFDTPFKVEPVPFNFEDEADAIDDFKSALKELIKDSAEKGGGSPNDDPEYMSDTEIEDWAKYQALWDKPGNIIEIGVSEDWQVAYVREYAPVNSFRPGLEIPPGIEAVRRLGEVENNRIIGGGFSTSRKAMFASFKDSSGVDSPRTVALLSKMHASNDYNGGIKTAFNLDPEKGTPMMDIFKFINENVLPQPETSVSFQADDPEAYHKATAKFLQEHGGPIASPRQRSLAGARSNNPSWAKQFDDWTSNKMIINKTDQFFASLPETIDRVRINEGPPYGLDEIWNNVLNRADIQTLTRELIKCAVDPQGWLELACRYAMKNLGIDALFEEMQKDGTMDKLREASEVSAQVTDAANTIAKEKRMSQANFDRLNVERDKYNEEVLDLLNQRRALRVQINSASEMEKVTLKEQERQLNFAIEAAMGRRRQVELDSEIAYANKSVGAWMPMTPQGAARTAQASQKLSQAIMDITDPNFKKQLCANIISYSKAAVQLLFDLYNMIQDLLKNPEEIFTLEQENRPKAQTDNTGMYFVEAVRAIVAQALQATILFFVRKLLQELVESCLKIKANLWADLNKNDSRKNDKVPGQARYDDLLAQTPTKAARDLSQRLSGFIDVTDDKIVSDLLSLMEDLELLLSQLELCALSKGNATIETMKIVKNLLKVRYNNLYTDLRGNHKSLSFSKIKEFFRNFEPLIKTDYCEELQKSDPALQLYQECPPYIETLCGDILIGHATNEQIDNICKRARMDRLDSLLEIIDFAYNPEKSNIPDPADPRSSNAVSQDIYPNNVYGDILMDQNLRPSAEALKSETFVFSSKLLYGGSSTGIPDLKSDAMSSAIGGLAKKHANSSDAKNGAKWGKGNVNTDEINALIQTELEKPILKPIKDSLRWDPLLASKPFLWIPAGPTTLVQGDTSISAFRLQNVVGEDVSIAIDYNLYDNDDNPQVLSLPVGTYYSENRIDYILDGDRSPVFLPTARYENFLNLYGETAPIIQGGKLTTSQFKDVVSLNNGDLDSDFEDLFYSSKPAEDFYNMLNESWPTLPDLELEGLANSKKEMKYIFNPLFCNIGNELFNRISKSEIFDQSGKEKLQTFFTSFFPQLAYPADTQCNIKETSLLKSQKIKKYIKDRKKQLDKLRKQPDLNEETSNLGRSRAEAMIMTLMRTYAFEMSLRVLPLLSIISAKSLLTSEVLINVMIENILYESAMIDYKKVHKTLSGKQTEDLKSTKPVRGNMFDPNGGRLIDFSKSPHGNGRYVEEPCAPVTATNPGRDFSPKFQAHLTYYANNIVSTMWAEKVKKGESLLDPVTGEELQGISFSDDYSVAGINYLLKEQLIEISDFIEREFGSLFLDTNIKPFEQYFLETFLYKDDLDTAENPTHIFDLMPMITHLKDEWNNDKPIMHFKHGRFYDVDGDLNKLGIKFGKSGGLILEPYIRVKQHTAFEEGTFELEESVKKIKADKAYKDIIEDYINNAAQKQAAKIDQECNPDDTDCAQNIIDNWHLTAQSAAQTAADNVMNATYEPVGEFNELFGDLAKGKGAYININQWLASMSGKDTDGTKSNPILDPLKLNLNPDFAKKPHTDWFDPWMYGLRLVYIAPLKTSWTQTQVYDLDTIQTDNYTYTMEKEDVLKDFLLHENLSKTVDADPLDTYNKKTYITNERIVNALGDYDSTENIYSVPLIEVETEVGSVTVGEKNYVYKIASQEAFKNAKVQGKSDSEAEEEAELASKDLLEQLDSSVALNYFTYQNWETDNPDEYPDDYPMDRLLCKMIKTPEFKKLFVEMFSVENYKTLLSVYVLLQSFGLNEYKEDREGNYVALFEYTKSQLRQAFYSNTMAHDPMTNIPHDPFDMVAAKQSEEGLDWWDKLGSILLGNPANYAMIFALTPIGILRGMVTATDPTWGAMPWTVPGAVMFILQNMVPGLSGAWFSDGFDPSGKRKQPGDALVCPQAFKAQKTLADYTEKELMFLEMMKAYQVPLSDANFVLNAEWWEPLEDEVYIQTA